MGKMKGKGKFIMNHENLLKGVEYVISFLNEVKTVTSKQLKYYKYPQFILGVLVNSILTNQKQE